MSNAIALTVKSFCLSTSQHGFRIIYLEKRTLFEKCLWFILIVVCLIGIVLYAWLIYLSYRDQLILITTDTTSYPIWNYQFPAVTICNTNKISQAKIKSSLHLFTNFSGTEYNITTFQNDLSHLFDTIHAEEWYNINMMQRVLDNNNVSVDEMFAAISPDCNVLVRCKWKGDVIRCNQLFKQILTVYGFCCSFNYFAVGDTTLLNAQKPQRVSQCGYKMALQVDLDTKRNDYAAFDLHTAGFYIFIHNPYDYLSWSNVFVTLTQSSSNFISIAASAIYTSDTLISKEPEYRKCYFSDEKRLKGFNAYTHSNCLLQCRMKYMLKECNCMPYYYTVPTKSNRTCTFKDIPCMQRVKRKIISSNPEFRDTCNCLGDCDHADYKVSYSGASMPPMFNYTIPSIGSGTDLTNHTVVRIFYNDLVFLRDQNDCQYNLPTLLAMLGGILGLFNGISITSLVEIVYFFVIRLYFNRKDLAQKKREEAKKAMEIFTVKKRAIFDTEYKPYRRTPRTTAVAWIP